MEFADRRPWGYYEILSDQPDHKVKRLVVHSGQRLSYQRHSRRSEHWCVVRGRAIVTLDGKDYQLAQGQSIDLPRGSWHRVKNAGQDDLVIIEIQMGDYFGEDDIERIEDDYGRV